MCLCNGCGTVVTFAGKTAARFMHHAIELISQGGSSRKIPPRELCLSHCIHQLWVNLQHFLGYCPWQPLFHQKRAVCPKYPHTASSSSSTAGYKFTTRRKILKGQSMQSVAKRSATAPALRSAALWLFGSYMDSENTRLALLVRRSTITW